MLLEQTLSGPIKMLIEMLEMVNPAASSKGSRVQRYALKLATAPNLPNSWECGVAALVSQIGCVALHKEILSKAEAGQALNQAEANSITHTRKSRAGCSLEFRASRRLPKSSPRACLDYRARALTMHAPSASSFPTVLTHR
jgi:hypothetical protein